MYNLQNGYYRKRCLLEHIAFSNIVSLCPVRKYINVRQYYLGNTHLPCQSALLSGWFSYQTRFGARCDRSLESNLTVPQGQNTWQSRTVFRLSGPNKSKSNARQRDPTKRLVMLQKIWSGHLMGFFNTTYQDVFIVRYPNLSHWFPKIYIGSHDNKTPRQPSSNPKGAGFLYDSIGSLYWWPGFQREGCWAWCLCPTCFVWEDGLVAGWWRVSGGLVYKEQRWVGGCG